MFDDYVSAIENFNNIIRIKPFYPNLIFPGTGKVELG